LCWQFSKVTENTEKVHINYGETMSKDTLSWKQIKLNALTLAIESALFLETISRKLHIYFQERLKALSKYDTGL
jgi:hypothetical protein